MLKKLFLPIVLLLCAVGVVSGHGYIEQTDPIDGSVLPEAPTRIRVWFSEALVPESGQITMVDGQGNTIELAKVYHSTTVDHLVMADVPPNLPQGLYVVTASGVVVSDGHEPQGSFSFWIGSKETPVSATTASNSPAYDMLAVFAGALVVISGVGYGIYRQSALELIPSEVATNHVSLD